MLNKLLIFIAMVFTFSNINTINTFYSTEADEIEPVKWANCSLFKITSYFVKEEENLATM